MRGDEKDKTKRESKRVNKREKVKEIIRYKMNQRRLRFDRLKLNERGPGNEEQKGELESHRNRKRARERERKRKR